MANFIGSSKNEKITPEAISDTVIAEGASLPSGAGDTIDAGGGNDLVDSGGGNDDTRLGAGNDTYLWQPGDGEDSLDGGRGFDRLKISGSTDDDFLVFGVEGGTAGVNDFDGSALTFRGIEQINIALGDGEDEVMLGGLAPAGVKKVAVDLAAVPGQPGGDGDADRVIFSAADRGNHFTLVEDGDILRVLDGKSATSIKGFDAGLDSVTVKGFGGNDRIDGSGIPKGAMLLDLHGGDGNDTVIGGAGDDRITGEAGHDVLKGGKGADSFGFFEEAFDGTADRILDFKPGEDSFALGPLFGDSLGFSVDDTELRIGRQAGDENDFLVYDPDTGKLFFDADGNRPGEAVHFATLGKHLDLHASDFVLFLN